MAAPSKPALLAFLPFGFTFIPWHSARHRKWLTPPCRGDHFPFHGKLGSRADHPVPYKSSCWMVPTLSLLRGTGGKGPRWTRDSVSRFYHCSHYRVAVGHDSCGLFYEHNGFHRAQELHSVKKLHALLAKSGAKSQQTWP